MNETFRPGIRYPAQGIHVGSQTLPLQEVQINASEQAYEVRHLAASRDGDIFVARPTLIDPQYIAYWEGVTNSHIHVVSPYGGDADSETTYLSSLLIRDRDSLAQIKTLINGEAALVVFNPTSLEKTIAEKLEIPLWGNPAISEKYGTKSGSRLLGEKCAIPLAPGAVITASDQLADTISTLRNDGHTAGVIKLDESTGGMGHWPIQFDSVDIISLASSMKNAGYKEGSPFVIEAWLEKSNVIGSHLELTPDGSVIVAFGWQQLIASDGTSYMGAVPLNLSTALSNRLMENLISIGNVLAEEKAIGSYGPDFMVVGDQLVLNELNARVPATAFPVEIAIKVRGEVGNGFVASHINLPTPTSFKEIAKALENAGLLITKPNHNAKGVVPFNVGLLPWGKFDVTALAPELEEALLLVERVKEVLHDNTH